MKNLKVTLSAVLLLLSIASWWACNQDPKHLDATIVDVAFAGRIIDENDAPVAGAQIQVGTETIFTDDNGVFRTKKVKLPDNDAILKVSKTGYFDFSRAYFVQDEALQTVTIQLLAKTQVGSFDNASGGTVSIPGGPTLKFPANSVAASGNIRVFARYLNPSDAALGLFMPGDLRAINAGGTEQMLGTFGMVAVELESGGSTVQIAAGKEVELNMPILSTQAAQAPAEIALWHYDTDKARWIEEGSAQKIGNQYVGKVKHFSFWNCDAGLPLVQLNGTVYLNDLQHPLANAVVKLVTTSGSFWPGYAFTDAQGNFGGSVFQNEQMELSIQVYDQCGAQILYTQTVGPFSSNATLPPIIISNAVAGVTTLAGTLEDCAGDPVTNGYVLINNSAVFVDASGAFVYSVLNCSPFNVQIQAFDMDNLKESPAVTIQLSPGSINDLAPLVVCTGLDEYIQFNLDGTSYTAVSPSGGVFDDSLNVGNTVYLSSFNGTTTNASLQFQATQAGTYPLTAFSINNINAYPIQNSNLSTEVTGFANTIGEYYIGTFSGTFQAEAGGTHTVSGIYRVRKDN